MKKAMHPFTVHAGDKVTKLHKLYRTRNFGRAEIPPEAYKCVILRSPISRVVSVYRNKVLEIACLKAESAIKFLKDRKITNEPSFSEFVLHFRTYQEASAVILRHTMPLSHYLGTDAAYFDGLFSMKAIGDLEVELKKRLGSQFAIPFEDKSAPAVKLEPTDADLARVNEMFSEDIEVFGKFF